MVYNYDMTKKEFDELTNEIDEMIDAYEHEECFRGYFGNIDQNPYISKMYSAFKKNGRLDLSLDLINRDSNIWIYEISEKLKVWTRCKYSYINNYKFTYIWRFLQQDDDRMLLKKKDIIKKHPMIIKEFFEDLSRVYFLKFYKNNPKEFAQVVLKNYSGFIDLEDFFKKNNLSIRWLDSNTVPRRLYQ